MDILLLSVEDGRGFMFELKSERFRKLSMAEYYYYDDFFPYLSFYIPGLWDGATKQWGSCPHVLHLVVSYIVMQLNKKRCHVCQHQNTCVLCEIELLLSAS
jgi:hypothetical protein